MPTLNFLLYLGLIAAAWSFRQSYLGYLGSFALEAVIAVPLLLILLSLPGLMSLRCSMTGPGSLVRGEEGSLRLRFDCLPWLPLGRVIITLRVENRYTGKVKRLKYRFDAVLPSDAALPIPTELCGQLLISVSRLECRDLLGLLALRRRAPQPLRCTVLPASIGPETEPPFEALLSTPPRLRPKYGGGFSEEHENRPYRPGDPINSVHWKLSAKTDSLIVREAMESENELILLRLLRPGANDRGLELLRWLSLALTLREQKHVLLASGRRYEIGSEEDLALALDELLSRPMGEPAWGEDAAARCVFDIDGGELRCH